MVLLAIILALSILGLVFVLHAILLPECSTQPSKEESGYFSEVTLSDATSIFKIKGKLRIMALELTDTQKASGTLSFVDIHGYDTDAATVEITSSDTNVFTTSYDDPTNTVEVVAVGPGVAALTITAKNKKGDVLPFEDVAIQVNAGDAVGGSVTFGEPIEQ